MSSVPTDGRTCQLFRELQGTSVRWNGGALITIYPGKMPKKFTTLNLVRHVAETDFPKICVKHGPSSRVSEPLHLPLWPRQVVIRPNLPY